MGVRTVGSQPFTARKVDGRTKIESRYTTGDMPHLKKGSHAGLPLLQGWTRRQRWPQAIGTPTKESAGDV